LEKDWWVIMEVRFELSFAAVIVVPYIDARVEAGRKVRVGWEWRGLGEVEKCGYRTMMTAATTTITTTMTAINLKREPLRDWEKG
jgi:hypothetical protein